MTQHENQNVIQIKELCGDKRIGNPLLKRGAMKSDILYLLATPPTRGDKIEIEGISLSAALAHPVLGPRLDLCTRLVLEIEENSLHQIFGSPDDMKFRSSMTLFALAASDEKRPFRRALDHWCEGRMDERALEVLKAADHRA